MNSINSRLLTFLLALASSTFAEEISLDRHPIFEQHQAPEIPIEDKGVQVAVLSDLNRLNLKNLPTDSERYSSWQKTAWRGERVNGQIALWSGQDLQQVCLQTTTAKSADGSEIPLNASFVRTTTAVGKVIPDIIDPIKQLDLPHGSLRSIWLSADIPANAKPGKYTGSITIRAKGETSVSIPVLLEVLPATLPKPADWAIHLDLWQHPEAVARWHQVEAWSPEHFALLRPIMKRLADAGQKSITCSLIDEAWNGQTYDSWPSMIEWIRQEDGSMAYDFSHFDQWVTFMREEIGIREQITCYTMLPWSLKIRFFDKASQAYDTLDLRPGEESYAKIWGHFLSEFRKHVAEKGWLQNVCIGIDERPDAYVRAAKAVLDQYAPDLRIASAVNRPTETSDSVHDLSVTFEHADSVLGSLPDARRQAGQKTTFYVCMSPTRPNTFTASPLAEAEWLGYFAAANHLDGILRWAYQSWNRDPFEKTDFGNWTAGDCFLVYPGNRPSLHFEKLRDGIEEFEKIQILRQQAKMPSATPALRQAVATMDALLSKLFTVARGQGQSHQADVEQAQQAVLQATQHLPR
jgi:hypothetical protein